MSSDSENGFQEKNSIDNSIVTKLKFSNIEETVSSKNEKKPQESQYSNFENYLKSNFQLSETSISTYINAVRAFLRDTKEIGITQDSLEKFIAKHPRQYYICALKKYFKLRNIKIEMPKIIRKPKRKRDLITSTSEIDRAALLDYARRIEENGNKELALAFKVWCWTGLRKLELLRLRRSNLAWTDGRRKTVYEIHVLTKGDKRREIPIPKSLVAELEKYTKNLTPREFIFYPDNGEKFQARYMRIRRAIEKEISNLPETNSSKKDSLEKDALEIRKTHTFRHALINFMLDTEPVDIVADFIGHCDPRVIKENYENKRVKKKHIFEASKRLEEATNN